MELHEYAQLRRHRAARADAGGEVTAAEVEAVARQALDAANAELNGLASPLFSPALDHAADGPLAGVPFLIKDSGPMARGRAVLHRQPQRRQGVRADTTAT